jgi:acyl-CoA hydrolase
MALPPRITAAAAADLAWAARGGRVFLAGAAALPRGVLAAAAEDPGRWQGVTLTGAFIPGANDADFSALVPQGAVETIFATVGLSRPAGRVDLLPLSYTAFRDRLARPGFVALAYATVAPPRADGTVGLGLAADFLPAVVAGGARLVGIVNPKMPDPPGGLRLRLDRFAALVEDDADLPAFDPGPVDAVTEAIAARVVALLRPGDRLQLGLGRVQAAVFAALAAGGAPPGLSFHGGMIAPGILRCAAAGLFPGGITTGVALGDAAFYAAVPDLPGLCFASVEATHGFAALSALPGLVAVNSVLEIDLMGQANAEWRDGRMVGGAGGLPDFQRGARAAPGGRAVLALPATARGGQVSRIVPALDPGTPVSLPRGDIDWVVTEHGAARLSDLGEDARAEALIALAAPAFRDALAAAWAVRRRGRRP